MGPFTGEFLRTLGCAPGHGCPISGWKGPLSWSFGLLSSSGAGQAWWCSFVLTRWCSRRSVRLAVHGDLEVAALSSESAAQALSPVAVPTFSELGLVLRPAREVQAAVRGTGEVNSDPSVGPCDQGLCPNHQALTPGCFLGPSGR